MKCIYLEKANEVVIKDVPVPEINDDQVLIQMALASICTKTDTHIIEGIYPAANPYPAPLREPLFRWESAWRVISPETASPTRVKLA